MTGPELQWLKPNHALQQMAGREALSRLEVSVASPLLNWVVRKRTSVTSTGVLNRGSWPSKASWAKGRTAGPGIEPAVPPSIDDYLSNHALASPSERPRRLVPISRPWLALGQHE